jgi:CubicO group peptidase (beta-lactamase class C family)
MKHLLILFLAVALIACGPASENKTGNSNDALIQQVENGLVAEVFIDGDSTWTIDQRMKHYSVPGMTVAVIHDGKIAWTKAYGIMDKETNEPVKSTTLFQAGSISKPVAAYGALKSVEMGKLKLDDDVNTYLASWKIPDNEFTKQNKVTLKHLVSHTGGLTVHGFPGYTPGDPVPTTVQVLDGVAPANTGPVRVNKLPGESFRYSGGGYTIMQLMMADVHGKPFPAIEKELVFDPIGMVNSTYDQPLDSIWIKRAATGYLPDHTQTSGKRHTYPEMAAAGLWTTAEDLAMFALDVQKSLKGESNKVISKEMAEKMVTPVLPDGYIGLGVFLRNFDGEKYFGHGGWDEGFSSEMIAHVSKGYGVVVLTNSNHPDFISEVMRSVARAYNWENYAPTRKKLPLDTAAFSAMKGRYWNGKDGTITISETDAKLFLKYLRGKPAELVRVSDDRYMTRSATAQIEFAQKNGETEIVMWENGKQDDHKRPKMKDNEKVPFEYLREGDFAAAMKGYQQIMKDNPKDDAIEEGYLNYQGYDMLSNGEGKLGQDIFKVNMTLYPKSANAVDSYAEACMKNGDKKQAIVYYKKALQMDPDNENAKKYLAELTKD